MVLMLLAMEGSEYDLVDLFILKLDEYCCHHQTESAILETKKVCGCNFETFSLWTI